MGRRTHGYTLYLDRAGLCTSDPLTDEVGYAETWRELHWMAKGAEPFERAGRLWARDEAAGTVLCMADMRLPERPEVTDMGNARIVRERDERFHVLMTAVDGGALRTVSMGPVDSLGEAQGIAVDVLLGNRDERQPTAGPDFDRLIERIRDMGAVLVDEDGSNDREHDAAYAVFEAAGPFLDRECGGCDGEDARGSGSVCPGCDS